MANFTAADVKKLREQTAAGMMDCKNALVEADGDFEKAAEILRIKGLKGVTKREGRATSNGLVTAHLDGTSFGVLLELACETDFVAKSERFQELAQEIVQHIAATRPADVPALLASTLGGSTVQEVVDEANAALGEKIEVRRFAAFDDGFVAVYLHKTSPDLPPQVGVLVELDGSGDDLATVAKETAQHVAAFAPTYVSREDVPADVVENERRIAEATAREEGKPEQALPKIVEGRVQGYFKENVALEQPFAKDAKKTVKAVLADSGATLKRFARFRVGTA
jgi:elongation factor Ts